MRNWLMSSSTLPKAPPWWVVFATCGVGYNIIVGNYTIGLSLIAPTFFLYLFEDR